MKHAVLSASFAGVAFASVAAASTKCKPPVTSEGLRKLIQADALMSKAQLLEDHAYQTPQRNRYVGTPGLETSLQWIYDTVTALDYYDVTKHEFTLINGGTAALAVSGKSYEAAVFGSSAALAPTTAPLVAVANLGCAASDYPPEVKGAVALISRGTCPFGEKAKLAKAAGVAAALLYNNDPAGGPAKGGLGTGDFPPTVGVSQADGQALLAVLQGDPAAKADVQVTINEIKTYNVIAQTRRGDPNNVLQLGAHVDSVEVCPGVNDDGSGTIGLLEIAIQLAHFSTKNAIRFGWWSAEEVGLVGSTKYVASLSEEERQKIRLYLNFDMIAAPNWLYAIYNSSGVGFEGRPAPPGVKEAEKMFQDYFTGTGLNWTTFDLRKASDHGPYIDARIPTGGLFAGGSEAKTPEQVALFGGTLGAPSDPENHKSGDNATNIHPTPFVEMTRAAAHAVALYGTSFEGFPERVTPEKRRDVKMLAKMDIDDLYGHSGCGGAHHEVMI